MRNLYFIALLLLSSCVNENTLTNSFPIQILHGNSAKVWVLTKSSDSKSDDVPAMDEFRKTFIFYSNLSFREQELIHLGSNRGFKGLFSVEEDQIGEQTLHLNYSENEKKIYVIKTIHNNSLTLTGIDGEQPIWELSSLKPPEI